MSKSSAGIVPCEPTELYNILTAGDRDPACLDDTYLALFDVRLKTSYYPEHILLARSGVEENSKKGDEKFVIPLDVNLPTIMHVIVYDSRTVSIIENTPAVHYANHLASSGSKNPVMVLKGGYERFSAEYPFLRTEKIIYTPRELQHLRHLPNEIIPLFLYIGEKQDACNASMNYDLKISAHVALGDELTPSHPGRIDLLHIQVKDDPEEGHMPLEEICEFIEGCWKKSGRVLVYEESGCSRSATAVMAYLIKKNKVNLKEAHEHVRKCSRNCMPLQTFLDQLTIWESQVLQPASDAE